MCVTEHSSFFPDPPLRPDREEPVDEPQQPVWLCAPADMVPGVVPVELVLGRSENAVVLLTGIRAFPTGLDMTLSVRLRGTVRRGDLGSEVYDGPYAHDRDAGWHASRLKWGIEFADGRRVTNIDMPPCAEEPHAGRWPAPAELGSREPDHPVLQGGGGSGGERSVDRSYWLWPLPPPGQLRLVCQWLAQDIAETVQDLDAQPFLEAAGRAHPIWPPR